MGIAAPLAGTLTKGIESGLKGGRILNKLKHKATLFFVAILALLVVMLTALSAFSYRRFSLYMAERHARSVAETVKVGLTESMINGTIDKRQQFLSRVASVPGVLEVRVVRGTAVIDQFGPGLAAETVRSDGIERVFATGKEVFEVVDAAEGPVFHAVLPYIANDQGIPNCLQCHAVTNGTVLGAVSIDIDLKEVRHEGVFAVAFVSLIVFLAALVSLYLLRRMLNPLSETAEAVRDVTSQAVGGNFSGRIRQTSTDEVGEIAGNINKLMDFLEREITRIQSRVSQLIGQRCTQGGNQLVLTTEMVDSLVEASQFKQAIEEDQTKHEIYRRLGDVLERKFDFKRYSIYEIANSKNRMTPMLVDGEMGANCRWCDPQILVDASFCRAKRTGHEVDAIAQPGLCTMFRPGEEGDTHICLPMIQSGMAGCVTQIVVSREEADLTRLMAPFLAVYLREAGPVLEAKRLMEHLRENALRDAMTGLYNRRFLEEYVSALVAGSQRRKSPFSVLMLDLDFFKQVNDTHGHEAGDKVIKTLADILQRNIRSSDMAVRYGGEEFLVLLLDTGAEGALKVAEKIRAEVESTKISLPGGMLQKTLSIGVAEYPEDSDTFWQVVKFADVALYKAKTTGRNKVVRFTPDMWDEGAHY
ncbi:sensor domain-containing diguanylate cyclase [Sulfuricystis thermophila]|uniref:sensor domain-containing diguanylate cyclase n=1 Tax=Sulfuricystis thermophila TaxID=2496847 RepID=UPI0024DF3CBF|nr:diguanylate cyclase [Sulfuricystis thermophila]